jgi:hypothetical protein
MTRPLNRPMITLSIMLAPGRPAAAEIDANTVME